MTRMASLVGSRTTRICGAAALTAGLIGCSVHPLPSDVAPRAQTVEIVSRIRCEAAEGLKAAQKAAERAGERQKEQVKRIIEGTTIGFEFTFVMDETNKVAGGELTFQHKDLEDVGFKLTLLGNLNPAHDDGTDPKKGSTRRNTRVFRVVDELRDLSDADCRRALRGQKPNLSYPITGSTGMAEIVQTYIELEGLTDLRGTVETFKDKGKDKKREIVTFSDKLDFTTRFEVGMLPDLELKAVVGTLRLIKASAGGSAIRKDVHSVTVVLARDHAHVDVDLPESVARSLPLASAKLTPGGFPIKKVRDKRLQTFLAARSAVARNRVLFELERHRVVDEDKAVATRVLGVPVQ
jgi:hypothetical protein